MDIRDMPVACGYPFGGRGDKIAGAVNSRNIRQKQGRKRTGAVELLASSLDRVFDLEFFQNSLERNSRISFYIKGFSDFSLPYFCRSRGLRALAFDEVQDCFFGGQRLRAGRFVWPICHVMF
jgi:hypothetical protein